MIYNLRIENIETYRYEFKLIEDHTEKIKAIDDTPDGGFPIMGFGLRSGRALETTFLPTKIQLGGPKRNINDIYNVDTFLVNEQFKDILEELEPNTHQFIPIELLWKDGSHAAHKYWFNPCNRLDSVDREKTTKPFENLWKTSQDGELVFNLTQIGTCHAWIDKFISIPAIFVSEIFAERLKAANLSGLILHQYASTE